MRIHRASDEFVMAMDSGCTCVFTFGLDKTGEVAVVGGRQCDIFPNCFFPLHLATEAAQEEFDRDCVTPTYELEPA